MIDLTRAKIEEIAAHRNVIVVAQIAITQLLRQLDAALEPIAPPDVAQAARVLLADPQSFATMVDVAEDIYLTGVSFNRVIGDALRAITGESP